jgi:hypothetical protein
MVPVGVMMTGIATDPLKIPEGKDPKLVDELDAVDVATPDELREVTGLPENEAA